MKEDNRKPWSVKLLQGAEMVLSASGMWGWLMLARSSSAPVTQLKWGLQSPPGRITGPHLCRGGVTRLAVLWGFASRSGKEDGLREREGCPREPGLQAGEDPWLQMRLAAVAGAPAQAAAAVLRMPRGERGSVRGLKGPIDGSQAHSGIPATQLGHAIHLSHSTLPPEWGSPRAYRLRGRHGFESTEGISHRLRWVLRQGHPRWDEENSVQPYETDSNGLGCTAVWGDQVREDSWAKGTLTMGPGPQPWASSQRGPHLRKM